MPQPTLSLQNEYLTRIIDGIGEADALMFNREIETIIQQNAELSNNREGFLFGGHFYSLLSIKEQRTAKKLPLHPSLHELGEALAKSIDEFQRDKTKLRQSLSVVLRGCSNQQDVRDALPNAVRMILPELGSLQRTRPVAWTLQDKPMLLSQFEKTEQLLQYYLSSRILY